MKIIDRINLGLYTFIFAIFSIIIIIIPFNFKGILSIDNISNIIRNMEGNYYYSFLGIFFFIISVKFLLSSIIGNNIENKNSYLIKNNEYGEIIINSHTIVGLVQNIVEKYSSINNIKTSVKLVNGEVEIEMVGDVLPEINLPEATMELQHLVKEHIELSTGAAVRALNLKINNVSTLSSFIKQ